MARLNYSIKLQRELYERGTSKSFSAFFSPDGWFGMSFGMTAVPFLPQLSKSERLSHGKEYEPLFLFLFFFEDMSFNHIIIGRTHI